MHVPHTFAKYIQQVIFVRVVGLVPRDDRPTSPHRNEPGDDRLSDLSDDGGSVSPCISFYSQRPWYTCILCGPIEIYGTPFVCNRCQQSFELWFGFYDNGQR